MEKTSCSSNLFSHPGRLLEDHLIQVARLSELFLAEKPVAIRDELLVISRIIALSHDLGKATSYFQEYLNMAEGKEKERLKNEKKTHHSLFSAVCSYYLVKELKSEGLYPFFTFLTVKRHHGNLRDIIDEAIFDNKDANPLIMQLESINDEGFGILTLKLHEAGLPLLLNKKIISQWIDDFANESKCIKKALRKINSDVSDYLTLNLLYSLLLDADKSDVVIQDTTKFARNDLVSDDWVDNYKKKGVLPASPINHLREMAYQEVIRDNIDLKTKIYSLNLPTGLGKTLTSLSFALKLRKKIESETGLTPRIIYALPFLSIIDQNSTVFESVIRTNNCPWLPSCYQPKKAFESIIRTNNCAPDTSVLLKHHHLSEIFYKKEDTEFEPDAAKILIEGWNSEIIVTTFIQFFHTLISCKNRSIRKFHRFANSIIILDEVQSIPIKYWSLLRSILIKLSEKMNTYLIFSTATEPLIFEKGDVKSLVNRDLYFNALDRVSLFPRLDEVMTIKELAEYFDLGNGKTYLFIFNTITSAKAFYDLIKDKGYPLTYLSTHITPNERLERIRDIKKGGKYKIVVATQLVEAGVDIDFDIVVRDIAPLDSINQAAGRCNRNGNDRGSVYIVMLKDDRGRKYASYIYDCVLIDITQKILSNQSEIKERDFLDLIEKYYKETKEKKAQDISKSLLKAITGLKYDRDEDDNTRMAISDFRLIEEEYPKMDVFIELDDEAKQVFEKYIHLKDINDLFSRKKAFDSIKADFYQYVISIPTNVQNKPVVINEIGYVNQYGLEDYYHPVTGFMTGDAKTYAMW